MSDNIKIWYEQSPEELRESCKKVQEGMEMLGRANRKQLDAFFLNLYRDSTKSNVTEKHDVD